MKPKPLPEQARLRVLFNYDPNTGNLIWRQREPWSFHPTAQRTTRQLCNVWNGKLAGKPAVHKRADGYITVKIDGKNFLAHRVIFKWVYGYDPEVIDHDDGDPTNNRIINLIDGTQAANMRHLKKPSHNTSGITGVSWDSRRNRWEARIQIKGRNTFLGSFDYKEDAIRARNTSETLNGFHPDHGK